MVNEMQEDVLPGDVSRRGHRARFPGKEKTVPKGTVPYRAAKRIRTATPFRALPPQGSASTNFAIAANEGANLQVYPLAEKLFM